MGRIRVVTAGAAAVLVLAAGAARGEEGVGAKVERSLEGAAAATSRGIRRAGEATGKAIGTAIDKTGEGVGTAVDATGRGLQKAGDALTGSPPPRRAAHPHEHELRESDLPPEDPAVGGSAYHEESDEALDPDPEYVE
jgi:hypothetical protein